MSPSPKQLEAIAARKRIPSATYRVQFNRDFTFKQGLELADYLRDLGITDLYASPLFQASPGSTHGYDICNYQKLNSELGERQEFNQLAERLRNLGLGLLLDIVPNHMGVDLSNAWWTDVLTNGRHSKFARYFDIHWSSETSDSSDKILLPILEDQYAAVLEAGKLELRCQDGVLGLKYQDHILPLAPHSCVRILRQAASSLSAPAEQELSTELEQVLDAQKPAGGNAGNFQRSVGQWLLTRPGLDKALQAICREFNGEPGKPRSFDKLHLLLQEQHYRLAFWRVGPEEINYRRFFDVTQLVSMRMEQPEVFRDAHELIFDLIRTGGVTGLRVDHPDGLSDPGEYFARLQAGYVLTQLDCSTAEWAEEAEVVSRWLTHCRRLLLEQQAISDPVPHGLGGAHERTESAAETGAAYRARWPLFVVAEKILSGDEPLRPDWAVEGTTGYDFLNKVNGLFVDGANQSRFDELYREFTGLQFDFPDCVYAGKKRILESSLASELSALAVRLKELTSKTRYGQDYTLRQLYHALEEIIAAFPIYRTYAAENSRQLVPFERYSVEKSIAAAKTRQAGAAPGVFDFLRELLLLRGPDDLKADGRERREQFVLRLQQLSGPVMAKGLEDTAFYNYNRLISLNEVGGNPDQFGTTVEDFHQSNLCKAKRWPNSLLATATHDTKRGEDGRARINVLSEMPVEWRGAIAQWRQLNADKKTWIDGQAAPHPNDEYLLYQTLIGAWPAASASLFAPNPAPEGDEPGGLGIDASSFPGRIVAFMEKAMREAKTRTNWIDPNTRYEQAVRTFIERILDPQASSEFLEHFRSFQRRISHFGHFNSLAQVLLKLTSPGIPDFYQGTELWDFSLVDPDNRRPIDFKARRRLLDKVRKNGPSLARDPGKGAHAGEIKLHLVHHALQFRLRYSELFREGVYLPLQAVGAKREHICAFARALADQVALVVAPRLVFSLVNGYERAPVTGSVWQDTALELPANVRAGRYQNIITGEVVRVSDTGQGPQLFLSEIFAVLPVALLTPVRE